MAVTQLASTSDVEDALGRPLTSSESTLASFALNKASELFRAEARQTFTVGSSTVRLKVNGGRVYLTQYPVTSVTSVVDDEGSAVTYERVGQWLDIDLSSGQFVTVAYAHGGDVPDLVRLTVAEVASRHVLLDDAARTGKSQYTNVGGPYTDSGTFASWAVGGQVTLSPEDKAVARSFRPRVPRMFISQAATTDSSSWKNGATSGTTTEDGMPWPS